MPFSRPSPTEQRARRNAEREASMRQLMVPSRVLVPGTYAGASSGLAVPKEQVLESAAYENLVRAMPCAHCGQPPRSQFCHTDMGKGLGIKTDVRRGWPGCGPHGHEPGCHWLLGTSGRIPRAQRRELEARYAAQTRAAILAAGKWPKSLPLFTEQPHGIAA
jgi:hypothetical protein